MLKKGNPVFVEGRLQTRSWEGQDGVKRYKTEIVADNTIVLGSKNKDYDPSPKADAPAKPSVTPTENQDEIDIEEIPF